MATLDSRIKEAEDDCKAEAATIQACFHQDRYLPLNLAKDRFWRDYHTLGS